ncbi:monocarboxylate transporter 14-like [Mytilus trossulus]|uniref:monocarboxylate transporter 14-like n=1 Tax=Mytilus trossulus TaxID=6551 RepID=UPI003003F40F
MTNKDSEGCVNEAFTDNKTAMTTVDSEEPTYPITSKTEPTVIPEHSEGQAHPVIFNMEPTVIPEHPEGQAHPVISQTEPTVIQEHSEGQAHPVTSQTEPTVIQEHSEGQAHPVVSQTEPTVIPEHSEGQAHPVSSRTEPTVITLDREGQTNQITSMTDISVNCSETPVVHSVTESTDSSHENRGVITTSDTREVNNIAYHEQTEVDGQDSQKKDTLNAELQITKSVQTSIPEKEKKDTESVLQVIPERKEEDTESVLQVVSERKGEDAESVLQVVPERKEEDTEYVLHVVPKWKDKDIVIQLPADECNLYFNTEMKREQELKEKSDKFADDGLEETVTNVDGAQDGGWGWFIVLSSLMIHVIIGGLDRSGGILYLKFEEKFKTPAAVTAWVPSISGGLRLSLGPVVSVMCHRFSFRSVVIWSGLILTFALIISGFAPNIYVLFVSYGVIGGLGQAMAYSPAVVIVSAYFHKKLGTAIGLATSGVGLGTFAIPLLLEASFTYYGYLGALIMAAAASFEIIVCGALMRPISLHRRITEYNNKKRQDIISVSSFSANQNRIMSDSEQSTKTELTTDASRKRQNAIKPQLLNDVDIVISVSENKRKLTSRKSVVSMLRRASSLFLFQRDSSKTKTKTKFFDFSLLKDLRYSAFCVAILLFTLAFSSGMVFLPAFALQIGTSEFEAAYTVVVSGVSDGIGRLLAGFLFDRKFMKPYRIYIYNVLIAFMGVVSLIIPSVTTFQQLAVACAIYGFTIGMYVSQKSVIIVDLLGIENLSKSFGLVLFFQGIGDFIGPPLSGLLKDLNGTYDYAFYFGGIAVLLGSCVLLVSNIIHFLKSRQEYQI